MKEKTLTIKSIPSPRVTLIFRISQSIYEIRTKPGILEKPFETAFKEEIDLYLVRGTYHSFRERQIKNC